MIFDRGGCPGRVAREALGQTRCVPLPVVRRRLGIAG